ncbi:MAG: 50S ribosomal protein L11 methyltransferase [Gemmatimonadaceae bacterium]
MTWISVRVVQAHGKDWAGGGRDAVIAALIACGAQGVVEEDAALVTAYPPQTDIAAVRRTVLRADAAAKITDSELPNVDWSEQWRAAASVQTVGALAVVPPWLAQGRDPRCTIVIEPGMAFGTGEHATTRSVLHLMQSVVQPGDVVADLGAGSAVLAIAAARLGARRVWAVENDSDAIANAEANVRGNELSACVHVLHGEAAALLPLVAPVRVVLANMVSSVLRELLPAIAGSLSRDGAAIFSGILDNQSAELRALLEARGWRSTAEYSEGEWWSIAIARK